MLELPRVLWAVLGESRDLVQTVEKKSEPKTFFHLGEKIFWKYFFKISVFKMFIEKIENFKNFDQIFWSEFRWKFWKCLMKISMRFFDFWSKFLIKHFGRHFRHFRFFRWKFWKPKFWKHISKICFRRDEKMFLVQMFFYCLD